ncbi:hypothetical protein Dimus_010626 [Dionaea muscipula]
MSTLRSGAGDLSRRIMALTSDRKNMSNECDDLKRKLTDKEEEVERLRAEKWDMKVEKDEANLKAHQLEDA